MPAPESRQQHGYLLACSTSDQVEPTPPAANFELLTFTKDLRAAADDTAVREVVAAYTTALLRASAAVMLARRGPALLGPENASEIPARVPSLVGLGEAFVLVSEEALVGDGAASAGYSAMLRSCGASHLAQIAIGDSHVMCLLFSSSVTPLPGQSAWDLVRWIVEQGEVAVDRLRLRKELERLRLQDLETGLPNRRHLEIVSPGLEANARRGLAFSVVLLSGDTSSTFPEELDRVCQQIAETLRTSTRTSDLVVRYNEGVFLVLMPDTRVSGATVFLRRFREQLDPSIELSTGIAEFKPGLETVESVIAAASLKLSATRRTRVLSVRSA